MKDIKISTKSLSVYFKYVQALNNISIDIYGNKITSIIGPSGCGKSSFLKSLNRMNDLVQGFNLDGKVMIDDLDIYSEEIDLVKLRKYVGMVFQSSNLFPKSIYENVLFAPKLNGTKDQDELYHILESTCKKAAIWEEIKDRLNDSALSLSAGQQQRLCIARTLAAGPHILLMDEPASALDPISTVKIEELIFELKKEYTIIIVTHNLQQAARISDYTCFLYLGQLVEYDKTTNIFTNPTNKQTEDYITGRFG